ncbi:hypothetical protein FC24_GL000028 [Loigolactobacillus rennini DSM 20253]|uniref:Uncharacterized protein n=3 Tax=Loigolactobacillus rennini TaxID=238013 RepID=A0A0R2D8B7_9LACO|nr:hypothetical protein FC24_GL000028 [Loigolactobacillus rennini DSM 20253]
MIVMSELTVDLRRELAKRDFLARPLYTGDTLYCLGDFLYREADAAEFLLFLHFLCENEAAAPAILALLGARQIQQPVR